MTLQQNRPPGRTIPWDSPHLEDTRRDGVERDAAAWDDVEIGDAVVVHRAGRLEHAGRVDNRTADGAVVWVLSDGGSRRLFHVADGFALSVADPSGAGHVDS
jgi:hypothetical protein